MLARLCSALCATLLVASVLFAEPPTSGTIFQPDAFRGQQVLRVSPEDSQQLDELLALDVDVWRDRVGVGPLDVRVSAEQKAEIDRLGILYAVLIDDLPALIRRQVNASGRDFFDNYQTYNQVNTHLNTLAAAHPDLASVIDVGTTVHGRHIYGLRISGDSPCARPGFFIHGCQHACEWISVMVPLWVAEQLLTQYGVDPLITQLVDEVEFFIVPIANPDGYEYTWTDDRTWRKNRNGTGVNLNRNWDYHWGEGASSSDPDSNLYHGPAPFSEFETQALRNVVLGHPNIRAHVDYHSYGQLFLWPWAWTWDLPPDQPTFQALYDAMSAALTAVHGKYYPGGTVGNMIHLIGGSSVDWVYGAAGRISFAVELRDTGQFGFLLPPEQILPTCQENFAATLELAQWTADYANVCPGDLNVDGQRDYTDFTALSLSYGTVASDENYCPLADLNDNGVIDYTDFTIFSTTYDLACP